MFIYLIPIALILNKLHRHPLFHTQLFLSKADSLYSLHPPVKTSISPQTLPLSQTLSLIFFLSPLLYRSLSVLPLLSFYMNIWDSPRHVNHTVSYFSLSFSLTHSLFATIFVSYYHFRLLSLFLSPLLSYCLLSFALRIFSINRFVSVYFFPVALFSRFPFSWYLLFFSFTLTSFHSFLVFAVLSLFHFLWIFVFVYASPFPYCSHVLSISRSNCRYMKLLPFMVL